jgi:hypothetical protein
MSVVICELPRAGLGNQLFPLLKAATFAQFNDLPLVITGYNQFRIGPYLRREKIKRNYSGYFTFEKGFFGRQAELLSLRKYSAYETITEPSLDKLPLQKGEKKRFVFSQVPHWSDFFCGLKEHRALVISLFKELVRPDIWENVNRQTSPCIGVHIRMGDFRKLLAGENFSQVGAVRTPEDYFIDIIKEIRNIKAADLPVSVFTDGYKEEFEKLFSMDNIKMVEGNPDIVDLILLSRSRVIVASANSTFSYWAAFLSDVPAILHPDHIHEPIRSRQGVVELFEGPMNRTDIRLVNAIKNIPLSL